MPGTSRCTACSHEAVAEASRRLTQDYRYLPARYHYEICTRLANDAAVRDDQADSRVNQGAVSTYVTYGYHTRSRTAVLARTSEQIITTAAAAAAARKLTEQPSSYAQTLQLRISAVSTAHLQTACGYRIFQPVAAAVSPQFATKIHIHDFRTAGDSSKICKP